MADKFQEQAIILSQKEIAPDIFDLRLKTAQIGKTARAGQFVSLYCADGSRLLPRPISICEISGGALRLVYRIAGAGTREFSSLKEGDTLKILGPLGNGFPLREGKSFFLIGGGIGIPPMLELAKELACGAEAAGEDGAAAEDKKFCRIQIIAGYRDSSTFLLEDFRKYGKVYPASEDGSVGTEGNVLDAVRENDLAADVIYACGPALMLRAVKQYAAEKKIECWISMEERMACGIGACLACVCRSAETDGHTNVKNKRICKEGPVFPAEEIEF